MAVPTTIKEFIMIRTAILTQGSGLALQSLLDDMYFGVIPQCDIALVISPDEGCHALSRASAAGYKTSVMAQRENQTYEHYMQSISDEFQAFKIDLVVLAGFSLPLTVGFLEDFGGRIINVKPSLLPAFTNLTGTAAYTAALEDGLRITGATSCFAMDEFGSGPIISQRAVAVENDDTAETLAYRLGREAEGDLLGEAVALYCDGRLSLDGKRVVIAPEEKA